ncbi:fungal-specific transcription factor domain-containing protein [Tricladium varicosporioides]|nr:fungal-specific transcription factor domain-containing protein [Hymenoscyphus varicosporioides]
MIPLSSERRMLRSEGTRRKHGGVRKRAPNACTRCRQQKIRCSGIIPCEQCTKRNSPCSFDDRAQKILVPRGFITDLEKRAGASDQRDYSSEEIQYSSTALDHNGPSTTSISEIDSRREEDQTVNTCEPRHDSAIREAPREAGRDVQSEPATPTDRFTNPFSSHTPNYVADGSGRPWYLGVSSNWSFNRRVLSMAYERVVGIPLQSKSMFFDGTMYDLGWNGLRGLADPDTTVLPSSDYAMYLINAVKFHCGQMFHLLEEESFMQHFSEFHDASQNAQRPKDLWYIHYLLILAFGKAFVVRSTSSRTPPGAELFVQAMKLLPDIIFLYTQPLQSIEILCSAALYLQCLDFRSSAYNMIGQALRIALEQGMNTNMRAQGLEDKYVERCRKVWWTVYVLDRQMSSLMGVPLAIRDEDISASLPTFSGSPQKTLALEIHVKLSRVIAQILNTVYGVDGRLNRRFMSSTKAALKSIASVTDQLMRSFELPSGESMAGISRLSAYLYLLHHQCVVLATRPLLFSFLKMRLDALGIIPTPASTLGSARILLQMCIESSQKILNILSGLNAQSLLESFLPFDLEAAFAASIVLFLAPAIDTSLLESHIPYRDMAYALLDEMALRGNLIAAARKSELQQLESVLGQIPFKFAGQQTDVGAGTDILGPMHRIHSNIPTNAIVCTDSDPNIRQTPSVNEIMEENTWNHFFTADQLLMVANSLDFDGMDWLMNGSPSTAD